jgi:hypothetical protein
MLKLGFSSQSCEDELVEVSFEEEESRTECFDDVASEAWLLIDVSWVVLEVGSADPDAR